MSQVPAVLILNQSDVLNNNETIDKFIARPTLSEIILKLAAVDRFSFNQISKSEFIRQSTVVKGFNLFRNSSFKKNNSGFQSRIPSKNLVSTDKCRR